MTSLLGERPCSAPAQPHEGSLVGALPLPLDPCGWSRLGSSRAAGQCFPWPRRGFPLPAVGSLSIFAIETLLTLHGAELPSWWDVLQLTRTRNHRRAVEEFMNRFSAPGSLRAETRNYSLPLQPIACRLSIRLRRCSPIFAICHPLRWSLCVCALSPLCFRCVRFVDLRWCGSWPGPGWVGLRSKLLIDVAMKISMSQIL